MAHALSEAGSRFIRVWAVGILVLVTAYYASVIYASMVPAQSFLTVNEVRVMDTVVNASPVMKVDRTIHQDFVGRWTVDVERFEKNGFVQVCSAEGHGNYSTDNGLPDPLSLDWWTWPTKCTPIEAGKYRVETTWIIILPGGQTRQVHNFSNTFTVSPAS